MTDLCMYMFTRRSIGKLKYNCTEYGTVSTSATKVTSLFTITHKKYNSIQDHIDANNNKTKKCSHCDNDVPVIVQCQTSFVGVFLKSMKKIYSVVSVLLR